MLIRRFVQKSPEASTMLKNRISTIQCLTLTRYIHSSHSVTSDAAISSSSSSSSIASLPPSRPIPRTPRRVVITGMGCVTPLGSSPTLLWQNLTAGCSGLRTITDPALASLDLGVSVTAPVIHGKGESEFDIDAFVPRAIKSQTSPFIHFALAAATQALNQANYSIPTNGATGEDKQLTPEGERMAQRSGVCFGSGIGCVDESATAGIALKEKGKRGLSAYSIPKLLVNLAAGQISILHNLRGPNHAVATACTTGAHAIGDAFNFIRYGNADMMLAGSSEASVTPLSVGLFARIRALSHKKYDDPTLASRPFDKARDGFVMGEGAAALVLEEHDHAVARGATIIAEVRGYGLSADASHITAPHESGRGAVLCMENALRDAQLEPHHIDYINAHATSTPLGDKVEALAIAKVFGSGGAQDESKDKNAAYVSSTKGALGHMLGAAGSVEALISILALQHDMVPPNLNLPAEKTQMDPEFQKLNLVPATAQKRTVRAALSNSFGFGGTNAALIFTKYQP